VCDGVGADVLAAAFLQLAAEFFALVMQAPAAIGIFLVILETVVFSDVSGHTRPPFLFLGKRKSPQPLLNNQE